MRCDGCGLANFEASGNCRRCGAPLVIGAPSMPPSVPASPLPALPPPVSYRPPAAPLPPPPVEVEERASFKGFAAGFALIGVLNIVIVVVLLFTFASDKVDGVTPEVRVGVVAGIVTYFVLAVLAWRGSVAALALGTLLYGIDSALFIQGLIRAHSFPIFAIGLRAMIFVAMLKDFGKARRSVGGGDLAFRIRRHVEAGIAIAAVGTTLVLYAMHGVAAKHAAEDITITPEAPLGTSANIIPKLLAMRLTQGEPQGGSEILVVQSRPLAHYGFSSRLGGTSVTITAEESGRICALEGRFGQNDDESERFFAKYWAEIGAGERSFVALATSPPAKSTRPRGPDPPPPTRASHESGRITAQWTKADGTNMVRFNVKSP